MAADQLEFAIALPEGWASIDLLDESGAELLDPSLARSLAEAGRGERGRLVMLRALLCAAGESLPVCAGLAVTMATTREPLPELSAADTLAGYKVVAVTLPVGSGLRLSRVEPTELPGRIEVLKVQYLLHTADGLLGITFTAFQGARDPAWAALFDAMAATARLDC
jgi:hypothetical protein